MNENSCSSLDIYRQLAAYKLPRWAELPDLDLYMDQVLALIDRYLSSYPGFDRRGLTSSMVNNYVKQGVMPPPVKKKYTRTHLAHLIIICLLKACFPIASIQQLITQELAGTGVDVLYDHFCELLEETVAAVAQSAESLAESGRDIRTAVYYSALRAQAEQALALKLFDSLPRPDEPPQKEEPPK